MSLVVIGLNHVSASLQLREDIAKAVLDTERVLTEMIGEEISAEACILSTCNRVEIYAVMDKEHPIDALMNWFEHKVKAHIRDHMYFFEGQDVVSHLFRVISSLDSMILGENQIIAQVREAYQLSDKVHGIGPILRRCLDRALIVAKKVRSQTAISQGGVSIGRAGVDLAEQVLGDLSSSTALLLGAGEHGQLLATSLKSKGLQKLIVSNRTFSRAVSLAQQFEGEALPLEQIDTIYHQVDIVLTSIGGGQILIHHSKIQDVMRKRRHRALVLIDLSVPRVIDSQIHELDDVYLFDVDDLQNLTVVGTQQRVKEVQAVEEIIVSETDICWKILSEDQHNQAIGAIFQSANQFRENEIQKLFKQTQFSKEEQEAIIAMSKSLVKKILHNPVRHAHSLAKEAQENELQTLLDAMLGGKNISHSNGKK